MSDGRRYESTVFGMPMEARALNPVASEIDPGANASSRPVRAAVDVGLLLAQRPRKRRELRFHLLDSTARNRKHRAADHTGRWNVLDPISRQSFRIGLLEHWILTRADGKRSVRQLLQTLRAELGDSGTSDEQLLAIVDTLVRHGLLLTIHERDREYPKANQTKRNWLSSVVVWQVRGIQPDPWLTTLAAHTNALFTLAAVRCWLILAFLTSLAVALDFHRLSAQSFSLEWILRPATVGMLFFVFVATRAVHELGHAIVCKRFGIRCPDIGLFIILGAPCVYCDVSESWQLASRWQRAAVAAAGIYVELIVATLAAWMWLITTDGTAHTLALQTMLVCSVSTCLINANPLMRFDGYYLLADWLDETNLRAKSDAIGSAFLRRLLLGLPLPFQANLSNRRYQFLLAFSIAGWAYRAILSFTIATVLISIYSSWNLAWIGRFLAVAILSSWWGVPLVKLSIDLSRSAAKLGRRWRLAVGVAAVIFVFALVPIPNRQFAAGWLQPAETHGVYASSSARLMACFSQDGQSVAVGQPLFELMNDPLADRLVRYQLAEHVAEIRLEANTRRRDMHNQDVDLNRASHELEEAKAWMTGARRDVAALTLCAPVTGRLVAMQAAEALLPQDSTANRNVASEVNPATTWCDPLQLGRSIGEGSLLACICSESAIAVIPLNENQLATIATGTQVRLCIPESRTVLTQTRVQTVVQIDELASPWQSTVSLSGSRTSATSAAPIRFAAVIELPQGSRGLPGASVDAVFLSETTTIAHCCLAWLQANLRFFAD